MTPKLVIGAAVLVVTSVLVVLAIARAPAAEIACGSGFFPRGMRCCASSEGPCGRASVCPVPLVSGPRGCAAPRKRVRIPETTVTVGPSDWEAEGRVSPRSVHVASFEIDAFEVVVDEVACPSCVRPEPSAFEAGDPARAAANLSFDEASTICRKKGGRLPTDDEWLVAAAGAKPRRYPWGDTGAVCRRGAWGLVTGPCAHGDASADTVGAHPDGDTELGVHDLAGNVAEWVVTGAPAHDRARLRGGSYATSLATELRTWSYRDVDPHAHPEAGARCAYDEGAVSP